MQSFDSIEIYVYARSKYLVYEKEENKCNNLKNNLIKQPPFYPCRILIIGGSGYGKKNLLFNLILHQPDIDKISLYVKDPHKA